MAKSSRAAPVDQTAPYQPECVCVNLRRAAHAISLLYDQALLASGLKITQFSLLRLIERRAPASINALAEAMQLDRTTLARNLRPLERDGLVILAPGRDRRVVEASLTRAGALAIAAALPLWRQTQAQIADSLGRERTGQLREIAAHASALARAQAGVAPEATIE